MQKTEVFYPSKLPPRNTFPQESVLFYDSILNKNAAFKAWSKKFEFQLALKSGESLKTINSFSEVLTKLSKLAVPSTPRLTFIAVGGGSVGDFVGFLASVYLRGRALIQIPSTWLAAFDSAHGGKNGLNLLGQKNQLGTFHSPEKVYLVKELLVSQPSARMVEALGEVIKIAIIGQPRIFSVLEKNIFKLNAKHLIEILPAAVQAKYKIVGLDPYEKSGVRRVLNLGHTMGHVFESHFGWPHGICILLGTLFSVRWSYHLGCLSTRDYIRISNLIESAYTSINLNEDLAGVTEAQIKTALFKDKKRTSSSQIDFIFIKKVGSVTRKKVSVDEILAEIHRQKTEY
ncbi:MAG: 3-dehydroquinate synthase [Bdellovibrionaceae bacterium]|nr:3-dehydroquinate synthase [Bdellovibrio sp.]